MKKTFYTPQGEITRELTDAELTAFADGGDSEARQEIAKKELAAAGANTAAQVAAIRKYLGV